MPLTDDGWTRLQESRLGGITQLPEDEQTAALIDAGWIMRRGATVVMTAQGRKVHTEWARLRVDTEEEAAARNDDQRSQIHEDVLPALGIPRREDPNQ